MEDLNAISQQVASEELRGNIEYRVARSRKELEDSFLLVYNDYVKRGYIKPSSSRLELSIYNALPQTTTFVAVLDKEIFCSATLIVDSPLKLPMDALYHAELNQLRAQDKKLCEISLLTCNDELFKGGASALLKSKKMFYVFYLLKVIFDYVIDDLRLDSICIAINPEDNLTYDFLLFKTLGELKICNNVNGAPVLGKCLDVHTIEEECKNAGKEILLKMFLQRKTNYEYFSRKFEFDFNTLKHFFVDKTDIFRTASIQQLDYIKQCYPAYNILQILMR